jgi:hypothetical protein
MDSSITAKTRRQVTLIEMLAILVIFIPGVFQGSIPTLISFIGAGIAVIGWAYATFIAARARQSDWVIQLGLSFVLALALSGISLVLEGSNGPLGASQLGFLTLAFLTLGYSVLGGGAHVIDRGIAAFYGGWGLLTLVVGGTLVGGAIGSTISAAAGYIINYGFQLYAVAGVLGAFAWVIGLITGFRTKAWGWFALIVLLPAIGSFMFGLFGPTRQDVLMAQEQARQRRAVGLN